MTNGIEETAGAVATEVAAPLANVTQVLTAEVSQSKEILNAVLTWIAQNGVSFLVNLLVSVLLLLIGSYTIRMLTNATQRALQKNTRIHSLLGTFLCSVVSKTAWILLIMIIVQRLGVNIAPLIAGLGVTGFILGFAFQESLGNLASGMMIAINHPFQVGDFVEIGGILGSVKELNIMAATLATGDNKKVVVPNKLIWGAPITNYTANDKRRVEVAISIAYGADIGKAKRVAMETVKAHPLVLEDPAPLVEVMSMGDSSVNLVVRPWVKPADYWTVFFALNQAVKEAFDKNGVEIPFPQLDVHMKG